MKRGRSLRGIHTTCDWQYGHIGTRGFALSGDLNTSLLLTINGNRVNDVVSPVRNWCGLPAR